ncbi:MAG: hypothetical protein ACREP7_07400 [Lysobacter sp.]
MSIKTDESRITSRVFTRQALRAGSQDGYVKLLMQRSGEPRCFAEFALSGIFPWKYAVFDRLVQAGPSSRNRCDDFGFVSVGCARIFFRGKWVCRKRISMDVAYLGEEA